MTENKHSTIITLGVFDGVHIGHQALIRTTVRLARAQGMRSMVYTFQNHPMSVFAKPPLMLSTAEERRAAMLELGVDYVEMVQFDSAFAEIEPEAFAKMLVERYGAHTLVAGFNYTFGNRGAGNIDTLQALGEQYGFGVQRVDPVMDGGEPVSSTRIRRMLAQGDVSGAARLLGHPYRLYGEVAHNRRIGTEMGFPTANLNPHADKQLPRAGVYATTAITPMGRFPAVTNIGNNPTVNGKSTTVETHILDFSEDLYGMPLHVELIDYLRDEHEFATKLLLCAQIAQDVERARHIFARENVG